MPITKPHALVTNDDGIESVFLLRLVEGLRPLFRVSVAAPTCEQSWKGRSMTRHGEIEVTESRDIFPSDVDAWAITGTPTDCVNIALGNMLEVKPDIVISGINIGYNTTETLILSSGTIAGAIEGALWGIPAVAFSQCVPHEIFDHVRDAKGRTDADYAISLQATKAHAAQLAMDTLKDRENTLGKVININFPAETDLETKIVETFPAKLKLGSLFTSTSCGKYVFRYSDGTEIDPQPTSDRSVLAEGKISRSVLDFSQIGQRND